MNREIKKILLVLVIFSLADGLFYNFQSLWMAESGLSLKTISIVLCLGALISCSVIFLCSNLIHQKRLKSFTLILLLMKSAITMVLFLIYKSNLKFWIKFLIMIDYAIDVEIIACIYPLMSIIAKNDRLYGTKSIIYDGFYYFGSLVATFLVGKMFLGKIINYNTYAIVTATLVLVAYFILKDVNIKKYLKKSSKSNERDVLINLIKEIKKDKISVSYLIFSFCGSVSYYIIVGIIMLVLVTKLNYSAATAGYITLFAGITSAITATLILSLLTFKNNYINIGIKYIGRIIFYTITLLYLCKFTLLMSVLYTLLTSTWYSHVTDAPYINRFTSEKQLAFANLKEIMGYLSKSVGVLIGGLSISYSFKLNYILAIMFTTTGIIFLYRALSMYNKEVAS